MPVGPQSEFLGVDTDLFKKVVASGSNTTPVSIAIAGSEVMADQ